MSTTNTEAPLYKMQEDGGVPTMLDTDEDDISTPPPMSIDENDNEKDNISDQPCQTILLDMKMMHMHEMMQSNAFENAPENSPSEAGTPVDNDTSSTAGLSKRAGLSNHARGSNHSRSGSWVSDVLTLEGLSMFTATCTLVNYLAAGYILLPWAFSQGGTLLTSVVLGAVVLQTYITASFVLEACARAQALELLNTVGSSMFRLPRRYSMKIRQRKYELSLLTEIFLGRVGSVFFSITTLGDLYGITWALCSIFANAFANEFPLGDSPDGGYKPYICIFMVMAVPLACTSITDQLWIQMAFMTARFVMVILMVGTVAGAYGADEPHFGDSSTAQVGPVNDVGLTNPSNIVSVTMTCIFATAFQFSAPTMASESRSKTGLKRVFGVATILSYVTNVLLGILLALFFGRDQPDSSNLNWGDYHGGTGNSGSDPAAWATAISGYIVLFAAIDGVAVYSLIAISTGEILMGAVYGDRVHEAELDWRIRNAFRLLGSIPQAIGAMFVSDVGVIANYAGIFTVLSYTVCPSLLALRSRARMLEMDLPVRTHYSSHFSSRVWSYSLLLLSAVVIGSVVVTASFE
jgi:hypothetical protein